MIYLRAYKCYSIEADIAGRPKPYIVENNRRRGKRTKTIDHSKFRFRSSQLRGIEKRSNVHNRLIESR